MQRSYPQAPLSHSSEVAERTSSAIRLEGDARLQSTVPFQSLCHDPGDEEPVLVQPERGLETDAHIRVVGAEIRQNIMTQADRAVSGVENPVPIIPVHA